jgi:hypothetical protein
LHRNHFYEGLSTFFSSPIEGPTDSGKRACNQEEDNQEPVGLRVNLLQIRLDGPYSAAFLGNRTTIALQNRQNLSSPSRIFASIS